MFHRRFIVLLAIFAALPTSGQATQPAGDDLAVLEFRARQAFNRGQYQTALPMLQSLVKVTDQPERKAALQELIRVCERQLPSATQPAPTDAAARTPHPPPVPGEVREMTIQELGNFEYDADRGGGIPEDVLRLNGSTLRARGYMIPLDQADNITEFVLVADLFACCFGQPPTLQHTITVRCPEGKTVAYFPDEIVVEGVLTVEEKKEDEFVVSLFEMTASTIKPAAK